MNRLAIECTADAGAEMPDPFWQAPGHVRFDPLRFLRPLRCGYVGHGQVVCGQEPLDVRCSQGCFMLVAGFGQGEEFLDLLYDGCFI
jgi:hypothetical protein